MTDRRRTTGDDRTHDAPGDGFRRREFVALGVGASATMLAGCAGDGGSIASDDSDGGSDDGSGGSGSSTGTFRLLISDAPADIGDFDGLDVTLEEARVFESREDDDGDDVDEDDEEDGNEDDERDENEGDEDDEGDENEDDDDGGDQEDDETDTEDDPENETPDDDENDDGDGADEDADEEDDDADRGYTVVDLDGATVDLTQVIEEDAIAVFDGEIPAGSYEKVELSVSEVQGTVDGEKVDVKLPSEKLQITNGFEVTTEEPVSFVFDINVVKRGPNNGYILRPVISGSGVAGRDVDVNEIDRDGDDEGEDEEGGDDEEEADEEDDEGEDEEGGDDEDDTEESGAEASDGQDDGTAENETRNESDD